MRKHMTMDNFLSFWPSIWVVVTKAPLFYKFVLCLTVISVAMLVFYGLKMHREMQRHHDFYISDVRIFVENQYKERTLTLNVESLSAEHVYITQIQVTVYDSKKTGVPLYSGTTLGRSNPLKQGEVLPYSHILDTPMGLGFSLTRSIKDHEFAFQTYKIIVLVHYNKGPFGKAMSQRFEYLYSVQYNLRDDGAIYETVKEFPNVKLSTELVSKGVPFDAN